MALYTWGDKDSNRGGESWPIDPRGFAAGNKGVRVEIGDAFHAVRGEVFSFTLCTE